MVTYFQSYKKVHPYEPTYHFSPPASVFNFWFPPGLSNVSVPQVFLWKKITLSVTTVPHPLRHPALGNWPKILLSFCCKSLPFFMLYSSSFLICKLQVFLHDTGGSVDVEGCCLLSPCKTLIASQPPARESWRGNDACCCVVWFPWTRHGPALPLLLYLASNSPKCGENKLNNILTWDSRDCKWYFLPHGGLQGGSSMQTRSLGGPSLQTKSLALIANTSCQVYGATRKPALLFPQKSWAPCVRQLWCWAPGNPLQDRAEDSKLPLRGSSSSLLTCSPSRNPAE